MMTLKMCAVNFWNKSAATS